MCHITINSYVKQQMDMARMPFPFDDGKKKNKRNINKTLKRGHICVIVNEAFLKNYKGVRSEMTSKIK